MFKNLPISKDIEIDEVFLSTPRFYDLVEKYQTSLPTTKDDIKLIDSDEVISKFEGAGLL